MRLARYLAHAGVASRRAAERIVGEGRVTVDGEVVTDPARDVAGAREVTVDGGAVAPEEREVHVLNKPPGVVSTAHDPHGRRTVVDLVASQRRLYPVGRLDAETTGLILLTNDGELANRLVHPRYAVEKVYRAEVEPRPVGEGALRRLRTGVELDDGMTLPARVRQTAPGVLEIGLREGRKRQVRRMCEAVGHRVVALRRVAFGPLRLGSLAEGESRRLSAAELERLRATADAGERARVLALARGYPYEAPQTSFVVAEDGVRELAGLSSSVLPEALAGARARDPSSGDERPLVDLSPALAPDALGERLALLAYGANRSPDALARKRAVPGFPVDEPIVGLRARLRGFDVVYSAHLSEYGAVASTLQRSPGTVVEAWVLLVTEAQLAALDRTELNYTLEELWRLELELGLDGRGRIDRALTYVSRHGCLLVDGAERALAAIPAQGRRLEALTEAEALAIAAARLGHAGELDDFVLAVAGDREAAAARTRELRRGARPLDWPHRRVRAPGATPESARTL